MARGKYKKKKQLSEIQLVEKGKVLSPEMLMEFPGNTIRGYCFTEKECCSKISVITHNCIPFENPIEKCRPVETIGCYFAPGRSKAKEVAETKTRIGQQKAKKRRRLEKVASRTSGKLKGGNCVASPLEKYCAKYSRAYKKEFYGSVMASMGRRK